MIVRRGQTVGHSVAATACRRSLLRRTRTATVRLIPIAGALTNLRSVARLPSPMGIAAMPRSPLTRRRAVPLRRGRILRPAGATLRLLALTLRRAAATRRRRVPTLHRAAVTAVVVVAVAMVVVAA